MSKFDECMSTYKSAMDEMGGSYDADLLEKVAKGLGPSIYNKDSSLVSSSDTAELDRVKENFLKGKLGLSDSDDLDGAIAKTVETMGSSNPRKHRACFYYLLTKHFGKEGIYS